MIIGVEAVIGVYNRRGDFTRPAPRVEGHARIAAGPVRIVGEERFLEIEIHVRLHQELQHCFFEDGNLRVHPLDRRVESVRLQLIAHPNGHLVVAAAPRVVRFLIKPRRIVERALRRGDGHEKLLDLAVRRDAVVRTRACGGQGEADGERGGDPAIRHNPFFGYREGCP